MKELINLPDNIIVISDVHASTNWKKMVAARGPGDEVIFLGDYFDRRGEGPFASSEVDNFRHICAYARANPGTTLLVGNHDYDYLPGGVSQDRDACKGFPRLRALKENRDLLEIVKVDRRFAMPIIFSHGGVTATFMAMHGLKEPEELNDLWKSRPDVFEWIESDPRTGKPSNMYGDDPWQSPIWAREYALEVDGLPGYNQIVGHTPVREAAIMRMDNGCEVLYTCTLDSQHIEVPPQWQQPKDSTD